jgi:hypothetical protein
LKIEVSRDELLKELGYKSLPQEALLEVIDSMLSLSEGVLEPSAVFEGIREASGVPRFLEGARLMYVGIATIGPGLEKKVSELFESGRPTEAYILDVIGSLASTKAGNALWEEIRRDAARKGVRRGKRRTPGCQGIDLETQGWILGQLGDREIPVGITTSYMMFPRKSLSFLARFGGKQKGRFSCKGCLHYSDCSLRSSKGMT